MSYQIIQLQDIMEDTELCKEFFEEFSCPINAEIEDFLNHKAILYEQAHLARTFLVFKHINQQTYLVGYFSLAMKHILFKEHVSRKVRKQLSGNSGRKDCAVFLIGQLGKNYIDSSLITGSELLNLAIQYVLKSWRLVAGRAILVECKDILHLRQFYEQQGFTLIPPTIPDELLQYYLYIDNIKEKHH